MDFTDPNKSFARPVDVNVSPQLSQDKLDYIPLSSPLDQSPSPWWDELLDQYNLESRDQSFEFSLVRAFTSMPLRESYRYHDIIGDLEFL